MLWVGTVVMFNPFADRGTDSAACQRQFAAAHSAMHTASPCTTSGSPTTASENTEPVVTAEPATGVDPNTVSLADKAEVSITSDSGMPSGQFLRHHVINTTNWRDRPDKITDHDYEVIYERYLEPYRRRNTPYKLLEIGLGCGMATGTGRGYQLFTLYTPQVKYFGFELNERGCRSKLRKMPYLKPSDVEYILTHSVFGDQSNKGAMDAVKKRFGSFDVIVDDGSHLSSHQIATFEYLFKIALKPGGVYIIEDLHTSFLADWGGTAAAQQGRRTMVEYIRDLIMYQHFHHDEKMYKNANPATPHPILDWIRTIDCDREICAFTKRYVRNNKHPIVSEKEVGADGS
jgi:hypothetical protein